MHPLSIFPHLFTFQLIAPTLLRLALFFAGTAAAWKRYTRGPHAWLSAIYAIVSILLLLGLYTQPGAIAGILLLIADYSLEKKSEISEEKKVIYGLMAAMLVSLLFLGPGFFALDLPL